MAWETPVAHPKIEDNGVILYTCRWNEETLTWEEI